MLRFDRNDALVCAAEHACVVAQVFGHEAGDEAVRVVVPGKADMHTLFEVCR